MMDPTVRRRQPRKAQALDERHQPLTRTPAHPPASCQRHIGRVSVPAATRTPQPGRSPTRPYPRSVTANTHRNQFVASPDPAEAALRVRERCHQCPADTTPAERLLDAQLVQEHLGSLVRMRHLDAGDHPGRGAVHAAPTSHRAPYGRAPRRPCRARPVDRAGWQVVLRRESYLGRSTVWHVRGRDGAVRRSALTASGEGPATRATAHSPVL